MKSIFIFLYVLLFSTTIHAKVEVLCLGEGECVSIDRNAVHPGSLSGASYQEKLEYFNWLKNQAEPYGITPPAVDFGEFDSLSESDLDQLDNEINELFAQLSDVISECGINSLSSAGCDGFDSDLEKECNEDALSSESCLEADRNIALDQCESSGHLSSEHCEGYGDAEGDCLTKPLDNSLCEGIFPDEYLTAQCVQEGHQFHEACPGYLEAQDELVTEVISPVVYVGSVTPLDSIIDSTGGSGDGGISYSVEEVECEIGEGETLIAPDVEGTCTITVSKAEDLEYLVAEASPVTITVEERDEMPCYVGWQQELRRNHNEESGSWGRIIPPGDEIYFYQIVTPMNHAVEGFATWYKENRSDIEATSERLTQQCHEYLKLGGWPNSISSKGSKSPGICPYTVVNEGCAYRKLSEPQLAGQDATCWGVGLPNLQSVRGHESLPNNCAFLNAPFNIFTHSKFLSYAVKPVGRGAVRTITDDDVAVLSNIDDVDYVQYESNGKYYIEQMENGDSCTGNPRYGGTCINWSIQSMYRVKTNSSFVQPAVKPPIR